MKIFLVLLITFFCSFGFCEDVLIPSEQISPTSSVGNELKDLVWNRYTTENFTILSIQNFHGKWLNSNIENIKSWCLKRWGIPNVKFQKECRIMVVPNKELLKKLFNISENRFEVRKSKEEIEILAIWIAISSDEDLVNAVPRFVTIASLVEFKYNINLKNNNFCLINGISLLNESINSIKNIKDINLSNAKIIDLFSVDEDKYRKMNFSDKKDFDTKCLILCLMLKKEFGENNFLRFFTSNKTVKDSLSYIYKFNSIDFDRSYSRYTNDILSELKENKVPNTYLDVIKN